MGRPFLSKLHLSMGMLTPSNTWFLGPNGVLNPNDISIGSAIFVGLTTVTDRPTGIPRYSVGNDRPHLRTYILRCGLAITTEELTLEQSTGRELQQTII